MELFETAKGGRKMTLSRSGLGQRAFSVAGPLVWNSIADCLRDPALELASFKRQLKTFLFARY